MTKILKLNNVHIGADKIGHFHREGYSYYKIYKSHMRKTRDHKASILKAVQWGEKSERGSYGYSSSRVYSYADLSSNLTGLHFWASVLSFGKKHTINLKLPPLIKCVKEKRKKYFKLMRPFDWADYVDESWNEAINCSKFKTKKLRGYFLEYIDELNIPNKEQFFCHFSKERLSELKERYQDYYDDVINFDSDLFKK